MADAVRYDPATKQSFPRVDIAHFEESFSLALDEISTANLATLAGAVTASRMAVNVDATTQGKLDTLHTDLATTLAGYLNTLAGAIAAARMKVDLATTPTANLATLAGAITSARMAVDLATTPTANLATIAGAITSARMAVDLATTPTANLATIAGAISSARMAVDLATTPTANLATLAAAISSSKMQCDIASITAPSDVSHGQYTVTTSAVQINGATSVPTKGLVILKAKGTNVDIVYIGKSGVTTSTGFSLSAGDSVPWPAANLNGIYAICAAGSPVLSWVTGI